MSNAKDTNPNPEVPAKAIRRRFTAAYKLRILAEAERCQEVGALGELLRRDGLYSSHLTTWRRQRDEGALSALEPKKRGRKSKAQDPGVQEATNPNKPGRSTVSAGDDGWWKWERSPIVSRVSLARRVDRGVTGADRSWNVDRLGLSVLICPRRSVLDDLS